MSMIVPNTRTRPTPYHQATIEEGVTGFSVYNKLMLPTGYGDPEAEYDRLLNGVSMWDVACERQVELRGPDAARLAQALAPRDLSKCAEGQGKYVAICNHRGTLINDPIILKLAADRFWISIADSDIKFWAQAIAWERGMDVDITEPDVSPLAVQGPMAEDVIAALFGDGVRAMKYFWFEEKELNGIPLMLARSGWSKQGGFEIYLMNGSRGYELWQIVKEAGAPFGIGPGYPNPQERIESGLLSWGGDTDDNTNPFEVRMGNFVNLDVDDDVVGIQALRRIAEEGPRRHQLGIVMGGVEKFTPIRQWADITCGGRHVGHLTNLIWSPRMERNIGYGLISSEVTPSTPVEVVLPHGTVTAFTATLPFV